VPSDQRVELWHHRGVAAELQIGGDALLDRDQT
jgi:hypothetical protein